jgi:hypothetical protein
MAVQISNGTTVPHATDYQDLLDKLVTFATAHGWAIMEDQRATAGLRHIILKGTGLSGTDAIYVGVRKYENVPADIFGWMLNGFTGYVNGLSFYNQPGGLPFDATAGWNTPGISLWNSEIPYWFFVTGRRIIMVAKISTVYVALYLGFILPYGTPGQWPYPLCVAGSMNGNQFVSRFSTTSAFHTVPFIPFAPDNTNGRSCLALRLSDGSWRRISFGATNQQYQHNGVWPYSSYFVATDGMNGFYNMRAALDDSYVLHPTLIHMGSNTTEAQVKGILGEFDGVFHVPGLGNAAEDVITIGADNFRVFQNIFRNDLINYFCVKEA